PASSSILRAFLERYARSPLSRRIPKLFDWIPSSRISLNTRIAFGTPDFKVSYVSTSRVQESGYIRAYALNASYSLGKLMIQLWAWVPITGTSNICPARTLDVPTQPPIMAALAP